MSKASDTPQADDKLAEDPRRQACRIRAGTLLAAVKDVAGIVHARDTIPILSHVLFEVADGVVTVTASDLDIWALRRCASCDGEDREWRKDIRPFAAALPGKLLVSLLGELDPDAMVELALEQGRAMLKAGRARFRMPVLPPDDFPLAPLVSGELSFEMPCSVLADSFAAVHYAISDEETRYYLNGIYVHTVQGQGEAQQLAMAATDGHRLARLYQAVPDGAASFGAAIVSRHTVALLDRLLAGVVKGSGKDAGEGAEQARVLIEAAGQMLRFTLPASDGGEAQVTAKMIDGTFPDYTRVIPSASTSTAVCTRAPLAEAIKRVMVFSAKESRAVVAEFVGDLLRLSVTSPERGEAMEELPCSFTGEAGEVDALRIGFNGLFWRDALAALASDEVAMQFTDAGRPMLLRSAAADDADMGSGPGRFVQVLMPMAV